MENKACCSSQQSAGNERPATSRELATPAEWPRREQRLGAISTLILQAHLEALEKREKGGDCQSHDPRFCISTLYFCLTKETQPNCSRKQKGRRPAMKESIVPKKQLLIMSPRRSKLRAFAAPRTFIILAPVEIPVDQFLLSLARCETCSFTIGRENQFCISRSKLSHV